MSVTGMWMLLLAMQLIKTADLAAEAAPVARDVLAQRLRSQQLHLGAL